MLESLVFWSIAAVLVLIAMVCVVWPLCRPARSGAPSASMVNAEVLRGQLNDLARDAQTGLLRSDDIAQAQDELQRRALSEAVGSPQAARALQRWIGPLLIIATMPPVAIVAYLALGSPAAIQTPALMAGAEHPDFVTRLQGHLREQPRDGRGWALLARAHAERQQFADAAAAYQRAIDLSAKVAADAGVLCEFADALGMLQRGSLSGKPTELIDRALALAPQHPVALEMAGSAAYERGRYKVAADRWNELLAQLPESSEQHAQLARAVERAQRKAAVSLPGG